MSAIRVLILSLFVVIISSQVQATEPVYGEPVDQAVDANKYDGQYDDQFSDPFVDRYSDDSASAGLLEGLYDDGDGIIFGPGTDARDLPGGPASPEVSVEPEVTVVPDEPAVPEIKEVPQVPAVPEATEVPEVAAVPEIPAVPEVTDIPEISEVPEAPVVPEVPAVPEVTEIPEAPVASGLSMDDLLPATTPASSELVSSASADKLALLVVDDDKVKQSLEQVSLFFVDGKMGTVNELSEKFKDVGTLCLFSTTGDSSSLSDTIQKDMILQGSSNEQKPDSKGNTTLEIKFSEGTLKLFCIKNNASDFTIGDLRTTLNGITELRVLR